MFASVRMIAQYARARAVQTVRRARSDHGELTWTQIIGGMVLMVAVWVFQDQFADTFQWLLNSLFEAFEAAGFGENDTVFGDGDKRDDMHQPGQGVEEPKSKQKGGN